MRFSAGTAYAFLSMILMSLAGPLQKWAVQTSSIWFVVAVSSAATLIATTLGVWKNKEAQKEFSLKPTRQHFWLSLLYASAMILFAEAVRRENPLIVSFVARFYLVFTFAFSMFWLKERVTKGILAAFGFILLGSFLSGLRHDVIGSLEPPALISAGACFAFLYAGLFAVHNTTLKVHSGVTVTSLLLFQNFAACAVSLTVLGSVPSTSWKVESLVYASLSGILSSYFGFLFYHKSLQRMSLGEATSLRSLSPVIAFLVIAPLAPPPWTWTLALGFALTILGCVLIHFKRSSNATTPD